MASTKSMMAKEKKFDAKSKDIPSKKSKPEIKLEQQLKKRGVKV